jgi:UDP-N-acetylmuramate dehydrogenase
MPNELLSISKNIRENEDMSKHTTFKAGGRARMFAEPESDEELAKIIKYCKENKLRYYIIGNGSDLLVSDKGYEGLILSTLKLKKIRLLEDNIVEAHAGTLMRRLALFLLENELTGFEFASGIPGTVGGAVFMNAGAYDGEMKDILLGVKVLEEDLSVNYLSAKELELSYRYSNVEEKNRVILSARIKLAKGEYAKIKEKMDDFDFRRRDKQPLDLPSAGSTFKRPEGHFAGKLISDAGLMGYSIGDAQVSDKHAGFVVNKGKASASEIFELICHIQKEVYDKFGVKLEREVKLLGEF